MTKPTIAEQIHVNSVIQGWILEYLEADMPIPENFKTAFRRKYDQLEKETQRLINPPARKPSAPKARVQVADAPKATFTPTETYVNSMPKTGRNRP